MTSVDQPAHIREMAARDAVKRVPEIARNHCPHSAKCAPAPQPIALVAEFLRLVVCAIPRHATVRSAADRRIEVKAACSGPINELLTNR